MSTPSTAPTAIRPTTRPTMDTLLLGVGLRPRGTGEPLALLGILAAGGVLRSTVPQCGSQGFGAGGLVQPARIVTVLGVWEATVRARTNRLIERGILQIVGVTDPLKLGFQQQAMIGVR